MKLLQVNVADSQSTLGYYYDNNLSSLSTAADMTRNDKITCLLQKRQETDIRSLNVQQNEYRKENQQPHARREWDLYDPDSLKKDKPARVSDDDPRCGVSSIQRFVGEDLNGKERKQLQQEQVR